LAGFSLGAATVLIAVGHEPGVAAAWEDSSYADLPSIIRDELTRSGFPTILEPGAVVMARIESGDDLISFSPLDGVQRLAGRPLFITHGEADDRINIKYAHELEAAVAAEGGTPRTWFVPRAGHTEAMLLQPAEYERHMAAFFRETIAAGE